MLVKTPVYKLWKNTVAKGLKMSRLKKIFSYAGYNGAGKIRILEIGCANGKDVIQFLHDVDKYDITGVDINDSGLEMQNFKFVKCDAAELPFKDGEFDIVITCGLLEHIEPMEKLCAVASEIARVSKAYINIVPSVSTPLEPHTVSPFWPRRLHREKVEKNSQNEILHLNFFTDHTWSKFEGFRDAEIRRFWYLFPFIRNTVIYRRNDNNI